MVNYLVTKEQLQQLVDDVRIPAEILLERLGELDLAPKTAAVGDDGSLALFFEKTISDVHLTADIEIEPNGTVSASIIPYIPGPDGLDIYQDPDEPIDLWEVEEPPPFEETLAIIRARFGLIDA